MYAGRTGGSYGTEGGGANYMCMPNDPQYLTSRAGVQGNSYMYGTEYESPIRSGSSQYDVPCAVCYVSTKQTVMTLPARTTCLTGWTREYFGYLVAGHTSHRRHMYECVDGIMETIPGTSSNLQSAQMWHVEARCGGMLCPPYDSSKELTCAVCSR